MKRREIIEFEVGKMEFGGTSSTVIGKRNVNMKGGITGQKVKASVKILSAKSIPFSFDIFMIKSAHSYCVIILEFLIKLTAKLTVGSTSYQRLCIQTPFPL